jgi:hypothetical protein
LYGKRAAQLGRPNFAAAGGRLLICPTKATLSFDCSGAFVENWTACSYSKSNDRHRVVIGRTENGAKIGEFPAKNGRHTLIG